MEEREEQEGQKGKRFWDGSDRVIAGLIEVHRHLGPGLLESAYEGCVCKELETRGFRCERQRPLPVLYKGERVECGYRLDVVVDDILLLELKAVESLIPIHVAQVVTYLRLSGLPGALLVNFNVSYLKNGLRRVFPRSRSSVLLPFL